MKMGKHTRIAVSNVVKAGDLNDFIWAKTE